MWRKCITDSTWCFPASEANSSLRPIYLIYDHRSKRPFKLSSINCLILSEVTMPKDTICCTPSLERQTHVKKNLSKTSEIKKTNVSQKGKSLGLSFSFHGFWSKFEGKKVRLRLEIPITQRLQNY